jgi:hypothetical protein
MAMMLVNVFHHARDFEVHHLATSCLQHESGIMGITIQHVQQDLCNSCPHFDVLEVSQSTNFKDMTSKIGRTIQNIQQLHLSKIKMLIIKN